MIETTDTFVGMNSGADGARTSSRALPEPPLTKAGVAAYAGVLAYQLTVSGNIPEGPTTSTVTYFVMDREKNAVVGNILLPNASESIRRFRLLVSVPRFSDSFDVGVFDTGGAFVSAGFTIEAPQAPRGAVGPG